MPEASPWLCPAAPDPADALDDRAARRPAFAWDVALARLRREPTNPALLDGVARVDAAQGRPASSRDRRARATAVLGARLRAYLARRLEVGDYALGLYEDHHRPWANAYLARMREAGRWGCLGLDLGRP